MYSFSGFACYYFFRCSSRLSNRLSLFLLSFWQRVIPRCQTPPAIMTWFTTPVTFSLLKSDICLSCDHSWLFVILFVTRSRWNVGVLGCLCERHVPQSIKWIQLALPGNKYGLKVWVFVYLLSLRVLLFCVFLFIPTMLWVVLPPKSAAASLTIWLYFAFYL